MLNNPTQQVLKQFQASKKEALNTFTSLLETQGYMGFELIDQLPSDLPSTIRDFIFALRTGSLSEVLQTINELDYSEAAMLDDDTLKIVRKLPSQCITRSQSGYSFVKQILDNPNLFKKLFGSTPKLLKKLPEGWQPIDYASAKDYGGFILALQENNKKQFDIYVEKLSPVTLSA